MDQTVRVGATLTENVRLQVGSATQTVDVSASPVAELQTLNASMGTEISGATARALPNLGRDASSLLIFQPTANPGGNNAAFYGGYPGGEVAGAMRDQNTFMLDGGNNTSDIDGSGDEYTSGFSSNGSGSGVVPTPVASIQAIRLVTNNPTADYNVSSGGEIMMVTRRGTNQWHGSLYDFYRANWLDANSWNNNRLGLKLQKNHQNRYGFTLGGPILPRHLGGKTFFFVNYEGRRFPQSETLTKTVPSALMRQGILQFRDATGAIKQYNLATSTACGPSGGLACDPRHIGISPAVSALWSKYMPVGNDTTSTGNGRDGLNTIADVQQVRIPLADDNLALRVDHDFGTNWQWMASYRYFREAAPFAGTANNPYDQVDWGGVLPGDTLGTPSIASNHPLAPRYFVAALTGQITPNLTNQFHFNYVRNWWAWSTGGVPKLVPGAPAGVNIGGYNGLDPIDMFWPNARQRTWNGHDWNYSDDVSWVHGNHLVQFGGNFDHTWIDYTHDDASGALTTPIYTLGAGSSVATSALYRPPTCTASLQTGCITSTSAWDSLYYETLGVLGSATALATRSGPNLSLLPAGTPISAVSTIDSYSLYASDSWHITPDLTFTYGINWGVGMPPVEQNGKQDVLVNAAGTPITASSYLTTKMTDALAGKNYNPTLGYEPVGATSLGKYPYKPYYGGFSPRLAVAWNPSFGHSGFLGTLFGNDRTVLRGGWARINDRTNGVENVVIPLLGVGFGQANVCYGANSPSATGTATSTCNGQLSQTAATAWRLGPDGTTAPLPTPAQTLTTPILPGVNSSAVSNGDTISPNFRPADSDEFNVSLQRQLPGHTILEIGWVGRWTHNEYRTIDLNNVPYMMTLGGQSFASAYAALANQILANPKITPNTVTPQPFFEAALATGPGNYCAGYTSCTAAVAAKEGTNGTTNINNQNVTNLWTDLENNWTFGPALIASQGLGGAELGVSNGHSTYNAMVISVDKRAASGLTLHANFTWSHSLDQGNYYQAAGGSQTVNPYSSTADYGPSLFDLRYVGNIMAVYDLPYSGSSQGWQNRLLSGWSVAPILSWHSGDPLMVQNYSYEEFGQPYNNSVNDVAAIPTQAIPSPTPHFGVTGTGSVGVDNAAIGINAFANPAAVLASFRPAILGQDGSRATVFGYGPGFWNLDLNLQKEVPIRENLGATFSVEMLNAFNHVNWQDPSLYLQDPGSFGDITGTKNNARIIELGMRLHW